MQKNVCRVNHILPWFSSHVNKTQSEAGNGFGENGEFIVQNINNFWIDTAKNWIISRMVRLIPIRSKRRGARAEKSFAEPFCGFYTQEILHKIRIKMNKKFFPAFFQCRENPDARVCCISTKDSVFPGRGLWSGGAAFPGRGRRRRGFPPQALSRGAGKRGAKPKHITASRRILQGFRGISKFFWGFAEISRLNRKNREK